MLQARKEDAAKRAPPQQHLAHEPTDDGSHNTDLSMGLRPSQASVIMDLSMGLRPSQASVIMDLSMGLRPSQASVIMDACREFGHQRVSGRRSVEACMRAAGDDARGDELWLMSAAVREMDENSAGKKKKKQKKKKPFGSVGVNVDVDIDAVEEHVDDDMMRLLKETILVGVMCVCYVCVCLCLCTLVLL